MDLDDVRALMAGALGRDTSDIPNAGTLGEVPGWDSLGHMRLVLAMEERLGRQLTATEIVGLRSIADIVAIMA